MAINLRNKNSIQEETESILKSGNACYHSVQSLFSSSSLSENINIKIYRNIILPIVLHGCETWSLTLREECRLRVFENRILRRIFWPRRDEVTWKWRKLHNEELNDLYSSPKISLAIKSPIMRCAGHLECMGARGGSYRVLVRKLEGNRQPARPRCGWEDGIKIVLKEIVWQP